MWNDIPNMNSYNEQNLKLANLLNKINIPNSNGLDIEGRREVSFRSKSVIENKYLPDEIISEHTDQTVIKPKRKHKLSMIKNKIANDGLSQIDIDKIDNLNPEDEEEFMRVLDEIKVVFNS
jgi:hypothetical protein